MYNNKHLPNFLPILFIFLIGGYLRFFKLNWGQGYFFHPDEYHIAGAVLRLSLPDKLNPELFSYGSFSIYLIYFTKLALSVITPNFKNLSPFLIGRFYSAFFSSFTIINIYLIGRYVFKSRLTTILSALVVALVPGLIQQAHFATPESTLTFFITLSLYLLLKWLKEKELWIILASATALGFAIGTKVTALTLLPIIVYTPFLASKNLSGNLLKKIKLSFTLLITTCITFFAAFPYSILDYKKLLASMKYEVGVAGGKQIVFYTRQFINTTPLIFQYEHILPYTLGVVLLIFSTLGFLLILFKVVINLYRKKVDHSWSVILSVFLIYFLYNSLLFAKWTRFINPTFPFFVIFAFYAIETFSEYMKNKNSQKFIFFFLSIILLVPTLIWQMMFFSIYKKDDVRITATDWINANIPSNSFILTETGNMLEVPLSGKYQKLPFDFYNSERNPYLFRQLTNSLAESDYFIVQSRRIFMNNQRLPDQFPLTNNFYNLLFSGKLGFSKIKEFNSYPQLVISNKSLVIPDELAEETWSVFDHPVIRIYKKAYAYPANYYEKILSQQIN